MTFWFDLFNTLYTEAPQKPGPVLCWYSAYTRTPLKIHIDECRKFEEHLWQSWWRARATNPNDLGFRLCITEELQSGFEGVFTSAQGPPTLPVQGLPMLLLASYVDWRCIFCNINFVMWPAAAWHHKCDKNVPAVGRHSLLSSGGRAKRIGRFQGQFSPDIACRWYARPSCPERRRRGNRGVVSTFTCPIARDSHVFNFDTFALQSPSGPSWGGGCSWQRLGRRWLYTSLHGICETRCMFNQRAA